MLRKSATWETALLPPQGRHAVDFFARRFRQGSNPRSWVPEASMLTTRPPKPLHIYIYLITHYGLAQYIKEGRGFVNTAMNSGSSEIGK